jgi:hypothetical protein
LNERQDIEHRRAIAQVPVGLLGSSTVEVALVELNVRGSLVEPFGELPDAFSQYAGCRFVCHTGIMANAY